MSLQSGKPGRGRKKNNAGFTMVEQVVIVVLVMILAGGLVIGITKWVEYTQFKRQNEYARTLFSAAQNQLTQDGENGTLPELKESLETSLELKASSDGKRLTAHGVDLKGKDGTLYDMAKIWPQSEGKTNKSGYRGTIRSVTGTAKDYKAYVNNNSTFEKEKPDVAAMYDLLVPYIYDPSIFAQGTICVELAAEDGQVFAVLYSDKNEDFEYNPANDNRRGTVDISNRETNYRKKRMVGYYGVDMLSKATSPSAGKPVISGVRLNNEDTLNLTFRLTKFQEAWDQLTYEIAVYSYESSQEEGKKGKGRKVLEFSLNGQKIRKKDFRSSQECKVTRYNYNEKGEQTAQDIGEYPVLAWMEDDGLIRVILDGADLSATASLYNQAYEELMKTTVKPAGSAYIEKLKKTFSFRRFGVLTEDIYCSVRGSGKYYKTTSKKQSNTENTYFGSVKKKEKETEKNGSGKEKKKTVTDTVYTLKNARHLYNIRYLEDYGEDKDNNGNGNSGKNADSTTYQLAQDIDWRAFIKNHALYTGGSEEKWDGTGKCPSFPSFRKLRANSVMQGTEGKSYAVSGLRIVQQDNDAAGVYLDENGKEDREDYTISGENNEKAVGLFVTNNGTLKNFKLDQIQASGMTVDETSGEKILTSKVGAFCGINSGELSDLETADTHDEKNPDTVRSTIEGANYTGGIFGWQDKGKDIQLTGLVNRAKVTGNDFIGGITGRLDGNGGHTVLVKDCKNYGVTATVKEENGKYIGGIAGYVGPEERTPGGSVAVTIENCISSPQYSDDEIQECLNHPDQYFKGSYVGGIVGYNNKGTIQNCSTQKETRDREGYVIGGSYVGGIAGGSMDDSQVTASGNKQKYGVNEVHVLGNQYVGGIVGRNGSESSGESTTISGWINKGVVAARGYDEKTKEYVGGYSGGIAGSNETSSIIKNCGSNVENNGAAKMLREKSGLFGSYAGGIAGYNNGSITGDSTISVVSYVIGKNYVGGITGYNDIRGTIKNYRVTGGYVSATGSCVGGYTGVNASAGLIGGQTLIASPNEVTGKYCVGGTIGVNIIDINPEDKKTEVKCSTDNFLGNLNARAFAGGFIGYNKVVLPSEQNQISARLENGVKSLEQTDDLKKAARVLEQFGTSFTSSDMTLVIDNAGLAAHYSRFASLTAGIYVGGVIGYNDADTHLTVQNVSNMTPVKATGAIDNPGEQPGKTTYDGNDFLYSYAGGIMGKVTPGAQIYNCSSQGVGDVATKGTYLGGICEVNEGQIQLCSASSIGNSSHDYVGGITGLNKAGAEISQCSAKGKTITGINYVGGIAAENYGEIIGSELTFSAVLSLGTEGPAGGIAAYNYSSGVILTDPLEAATIESGGANVGGFAGINEGMMEGRKESEEAEISSSCYITGEGNVGGIVGWNKANDITGLTSKASVTARNGNAGGIAGAAAVGISIKDCNNEGEVFAEQSGNAGGITGNNQGSILNCRNTEEIAAPNGICGGIAGNNAPDNGKIEDCTVGSGLTFIGLKYAGGICGVNGGQIANCTVGQITVTNPSKARGSALGGVAGHNDNHISDCIVGRSGNAVRLVSNAADVSMGGVAGVNTGELSGNASSLGFGLVYADLSFVRTEQSYFGNMGGISGTNTGTVSKFEYSGRVAGTGNNPQLSPEYNPNTDMETNGARIYGYGGIAGVNEARITDCKVNKAKITGLGDPNNIANIGGVAGVNGTGAQISRVTFGTGTDYGMILASNPKKGAKLKETKDAKASVYVGTDNASDSKTMYAHAGGIAGFNSGSIHSIGFDENENTYDKAYDETAVIVEGYRGHIGGIAGYNRRTGKISHASTGKKWAVYAYENAQDNGCGGITGYQSAESGMEYCINRASVEKSVAKSNGTGGMAGRLEVATAGSWSISHCANYGKIYGDNRVGGMIGVWKYYGGTISNCVNYGPVTAAGSEGAGGIAGCFYSLNTTAANIIRCENHGTITGNGGAGGIAGKNAGTEAAYFKILRCANTGLISANRSNGGILGAAGKVNSKSAVIACNNYGFAVGGKDFSSPNNLDGIVSLNAASVTVRKCFGITDTSYPIVARKKENVKEDQDSSVKVDADESNYYLTEAGTDHPEAGKNKGTGATVEEYAPGGYYTAVTGPDKEEVQIGLPGYSSNPTTIFKDREKAYSDTSLKASGSTTDNIRYQVFQADDRYFNTDAQAGMQRPQDPEITSFKDSGNASYTAGWNAVQDAYYYNYEVHFYGQGNIELNSVKGTVYDTSVTMPVSPVDGKRVEKVRLSVWACADTVNEEGQIVTLISEKPGEIEEDIAPVLPTPQYHLELTCRKKSPEQNASLEYRAYLDNREEYVEFLKAWGENPENVLEKINIKVGGTGLVFTAKDGVSGKFYKGSSKTNATFTAEAVYTAETQAGKFTSSVKQMRESQSPNDSDYRGGAMAKVRLQPDNSQVGFRGDSADTLNYQLMIGHDGLIVYMRSELLAVDKKLGVPVAVSTSQFRTADTTTEMLKTALGSLPVDLLDDKQYENLMVRSYPAMMSNNIVYTGHAVNLDGIQKEDARTGLTRDQLEQLYVTDSNQASEEDTGRKLISVHGEEKKLAAGFVIELTADNSYILYYNALLDYNETGESEPYAYDEDEKEQAVKTQVFYYHLPESSRKPASKPEIHTNIENGIIKDEDEILVITWDPQGGDAYKKDAVYDYAITGYTKDGASVQIEEGEYITEEGKENKLTYDTQTWNYTRLIIEISRRGTVDSNGMTSVFPAGNKVEEDLKLRLSQITKPDITLYKKDGVVQKNSLIYDVSWDHIPEKELEELEAYEIRIACAKDSGKRTYESKNDYDKALDSAKKLYEGKAAPAAGDGQNIYEWQESYQGMNVRKTMVLSWQEDVTVGLWSITRNLTEIWTVYPEAADAQKDRMTRTLDLNDFGRGDAIELSVRARAEKDAKAYRDGPAGVVRDMMLPSRLDVPDVRELSGSPAYYRHGDKASEDDGKSYITLEEYEKDGLELTVASQMNDGSTAGQYQLAVAVYDQKPGDADTDVDKIESAGDGGPQSSGYWDFGAVETLVGKDGEEGYGKMEGDLVNASYRLKPGNSAYAGKWLKIAMRSVSESNISSLWSDEDETQDGTLNYQWIQIPRIQIATPGLTQDTKDLFYNEEGIWLGDPSQSGMETVGYTVRQTSLSFNLSENADSYQIQLIRNIRHPSGDILPGDFGIYDLDLLNIEKSGEDSYDLYYTSSDPEVKKSLSQLPVYPDRKSFIDDAAVYIGTITGREYFKKLPYDGVVAISANDAEAVIHTASYLRRDTLADGTLTGFTIVLPDTENYNNLGWYATSQASVQARVARENAKEYQYSLRYEDSGVCDWYREKGKEEATHIISMEDYQKAPGESEVTINQPEYAPDGDVYKITGGSARNWVVYRLEMLDGSGNIMKKEYVSAYGAGTSNIETAVLLPAEDYRQYAAQGIRIRIRVACVFSGWVEAGSEGGGLSHWSEWYVTCTLPQIPNQPVQVEEYDMGTDTGMLAVPRQIEAPSGSEEEKGQEATEENQESEDAGSPDSTKEDAAPAAPKDDGNSEEGYRQ